MKAYFLHGAASVAGVSAGLASSGAQIRNLSLATSHYVFVLALYRPSSQVKWSCLSQRPRIFEFPYIIVAYTLVGDLSGYASPILKL